MTLLASTDKTFRRRRSWSVAWLAAAAAILSGKLAATMRALASAVLAATRSAGSSGYLSVKVYVAPLTAAVHVALKPSSVRACGAPVRDMHGTPAAGTHTVQRTFSTAHVRYRPAALSLWYVQHAGGWQAEPVRTARRPRSVRVS